MTALDPGKRHFACTACGRCCDSGPEMELGETIALADRFVIALLFKVHGLPASERSGWAQPWWRDEQSRIPLRPALEEKRRQLGAFASRKTIDNPRERHRYLTISAMAQDFGRKRCPHLVDDLCAIHAIRPLTCRTVPLHYSRPPSTLAAYLDGFVGTPGYRCDTSPSAPLVLDGRRIVDREVAQARDAAIARAKADRGWKEHLLLLMDDPATAAAARLPTYDAVLEQSDNGYASSVPMLAAWRALREDGAMTAAAFEDVCRKQLALIQHEISVSEDPAVMQDLLDMRAAYDQSLSGLRQGSATQPHAMLAHRAPLTP
ncbi:YkgJ family cysteine cluster protein [Sphingomonas abietis]|uniref:YkgJ family cysteine cluster protein n=1 Tax=Sphingomonas abietis TaxID=3012344 RepID=A0ABY7NRF3_9SPHN|nr:YkgJ family cysteine cluster protein [Sphingomonas abietis]WBO24132.1 YkgJ family cysteine cluster protein [Sphingomonas abietis]